MKKNFSPWLRQLNPDRKRHALGEDIKTDVAVVGAGIAGIATAFFILKNTDKKVGVFERSQLAHGATGHNAGQVVSYFERSFESMVEEFGLEMAAKGQKDIEDAWGLLEEMYTDAGLDIPFSRFKGHAGLSSYDQILWHLKNNLLRKQGGLKTEELLISSAAHVAGAIPPQFAGLYQVVPQEEVLKPLETKMTEFIAVLSYQKGCINSALFCQEVVSYLLTTYPDRFALYEHTPVGKIILKSDHAMLDGGEYAITATHVVLCTNGFESLRILNETGLDIDAKYHYLVRGKIGYMSGYLEMMTKAPTAISYFTDPIASIDNSYYYLTRRPYEFEKNTSHNLISVGGPEKNLEETLPYSHEDEYPEEMGEKIDEVIHKLYSMDEAEKIDYVFTWHGLMGYTANGMRLVGEEPQNPVLLYNLGCNGVGILPSIYGGKKIARHVSGDTVEKTIFDIPERKP